MRNLDRLAHMETYPELAFPNMFLLKGGYKAFFELYSVSDLQILCTNLTPWSVVVQLFCFCLQQFCLNWQSLLIHYSRDQETDRERERDREREYTRLEHYFQIFQTWSSQMGPFPTHVTHLYRLIFESFQPSSQLSIPNMCICQTYLSLPCAGTLCAERICKDVWS